MGALASGNLDPRGIRAGKSVHFSAAGGIGVVVLALPAIDLALVLPPPATVQIIRFRREAVERIVALLMRPPLRQGLLAIVLGDEVGHGDSELPKLADRPGQKPVVTTGEDTVSGGDDYPGLKL